MTDDRAPRPGGADARREHRAANLAHAIAEAGWDALLLSSPENVYFSSGAHIHTQALIRRRQAMAVLSATGEGALVVAEVERGLAATHNRLPQLLDYREFHQTAIDVVLPLLRPLVKRGASLGVEMEHLPAGDYETLRRHLPSVQFVAADERLRALRSIKSSVERAQYAQAAPALDRAIAAATMTAQPGIREDQLAAAIVANVYAIAGAEARTVVGLVAGGHNLLTTHHVADRTLLRPGDVLRVGCRATFGAYHALVARTAMVAPARAELLDLHQRLVSAREDLIASLRPGPSGDEVFQRAHRFRASIGLPLETAHVGHGIGLEFQELPRLRPGSLDRVAPGMVLLSVCVTRIPELGLLYLEDLVDIGNDSAALLSQHSQATPLIIG